MVVARPDPEKDRPERELARLVSDRPGKETALLADAVRLGTANHKTTRLERGSGT